MQDMFDGDVLAINEEVLAGRGDGANLATVAEVLDMVARDQFQGVDRAGNDPLTVAIVRVAIAESDQTAQPINADGLAIDAMKEALNGIVGDAVILETTGGFAEFPFPDDGLDAENTRTVHIFPPICNVRRLKNTLSYHYITLLLKMQYFYQFFEIFGKFCGIFIVMAAKKPPFPGAF